MREIDNRPARAHRGRGQSHQRGHHADHDRPVGQRDVLPRSQGLRRRRTGDRQQRLLAGLPRRASAPACRTCSAARSRRSPASSAKAACESYERMVAEAQKHGAHRHHRRHQRAAPHAGQHRVPLRRLVHPREPTAPQPKVPFSTSGDGQELYCQLDAGYTPRQVRLRQRRLLGRHRRRHLRLAQEPGARRGARSSATSSTRTRHLAPATASSAEARAAGANAVVGIETRVMPFSGVHEMLMIGTAAHHPSLSVAGDATSPSPAT